jgi:hypothetical protein
MKYQHGAANKPYFQHLGIGNMAINGLTDSLASGNDC